MKPENQNDSVTDRGCVSHLVRQFDFRTGTPPVSGWYIVELDQPGLINSKPYDVDMCRLREDSEGGIKVEWAYWYAHNIRRWASLPNSGVLAHADENLSDQ